MSEQSIPRLEALSRYARRLVEDSSGGVFGDALEAIIEAGPAEAGVAFVCDPAVEAVAERGFEDRSHAWSAALRVLLQSLAEQTAELRAPIAQVTSESGPVSHELTALGIESLLCVPILHHRRARGVLLLLFGKRTKSDEATTEFVSTVANLLALVLDREEQLEYERARRAELEETQRMASLGLLTASVSQELRGPVAALSVQHEEQRRLLEQLTSIGLGDPMVRETVSELSELTLDIEAAGTRLQQTVDQLSALSRRDGAPEALDLSRVVRDALAIARSSLDRRGIALREELPSGCITQGRRENLAQVVLNLVFNAADACDRVRRARPQVSVRVVDADEHVLLTVEDTGPGVPEDAVRLIFRPFYTTKQQGFAAGLGLKVCSDVVAAHGGHIEVQNRPSGGAQFRVVLQKMADTSGVHPVARANAQDLPPRPGPRQILIVDDDPVFLRAVRRALKPAQVKTADTASDAEIALLGSDYLPDLVLCDVFLPGMNGHELHRRICARRPELQRRFVFVTGGALTSAEAEYIKNSGCRTLFKPVSIDEIGKLLELSPDSVPPNSVHTLRPYGSEHPDSRSGRPPTT